MAESNRYLRATTSHDLNTGALSYTTSFGTNFQLCSVHLHWSSATSQVISVSFTSRDGTNYSVALDVPTPSSITSYVFRPSGNCIFMDGDEVTVACANSGHPGIIVYATIIAEPYGRQAAGSITAPGL